MNRVSRNIVFITMLFVSVSAGAQQVFPFIESDPEQLFTRLEEAQVNHVNSLYLKNTTSPRELIHGKEYERYWKNSKKSPLLYPETDRMCSIVFRGRSYDNIVLQYDTFTDQVIYTDDNLIFGNRVWQVALNSDYIERFDLRLGYDTLKFKYFRSDQDSTFTLKDGFYEVVYDSKCKYIIRHISTRAIVQGIDKYYYSPVGYVRIGNEYSEIISKDQFIRLFGDKSAAVKQMIRHYNIRVVKPDKTQIAEVLKYYEMLD